jgi:hypothetical protein
LARRRRRRTQEKVRIQGKSKFSQIQQNLTKSSKARPRKGPGINFDFLVRIEPYQGLALTPQGVFFFDLPDRPKRLARIEPPLLAGGGMFYKYS